MSTEAKRAWREYFDSEYITGDALPDEGRTFTIADKSRDEVEGKDGKEHKLALTFTDRQRWLVNITNATCLAKMFGSVYPADWLGHKVTLVFDPTVKFGKETVGGIRVKGSPELTKPLSFEFQENSRRKPHTITLVPTAEEDELDAALAEARPEWQEPDPTADYDDGAAAAEEFFTGPGQP